MVEERIEELNQSLLGGITPAMATPIDGETGQVQLDAVAQLIDFLIAKGVSGLFVGGTTGEGVLLGIEQRRILHEATMTAVAGRVPVLLHVGSLRTDSAVELAHHAASIGADAIAAVTPIFYGINDDALAAYYLAVAEAAPETPLFAYDIRHMAVNGISPVLAERLFAGLPSLAGLKSSSPDAQALRRLIEVIPDGRVLLAGNESIALGSLALGADGMISGLATAVPEPFVAMIDAFNTGDLSEARRQQRLINGLLATIPSGARIGALKALLEARGIPVGPPILPLPEVRSHSWIDLEEILKA